MKPILAPFLILSFLALPTFAKTKLENVELTWKNTTEYKDIIDTKLGSVQAKFTILPFTDARTVDPINKVGENKEDEKKGVILPVTTSSDVAAFVTENFLQSLRKSGLEILSSGGDYTLAGEITEFFVTETNTYQGILTVKLTLSKGKKQIWKSTVTGTNKRFGRTYKLDNYLETLSDTIMEFTLGLAKDPEFKSKLQ